MIIIPLTIVWVLKQYQDKTIGQNEWNIWEESTYNIKIINLRINVYWKTHQAKWQNSVCELDIGCLKKIYCVIWATYYTSAAHVCNTFHCEYRFFPQTKTRLRTIDYFHSDIHVGTQYLNSMPQYIFVYCHCDQEMCRILYSSTVTRVSLHLLKESYNFPGLDINNDMCCFY